MTPDEMLIGIRNKEYKALEKFFHNIRLAKVKCDTKILKHPAWVADAIQDTMLKLMEITLPERVTDYSKLKGYVFKMNKNFCLQILRREVKYLPFETGEDSKDGSDGKTSSIEPGQSNSLLQEQLKQQLELLPQEQRIILNLKYYQNSSWGEIAKVFHGDDSLANISKCRRIYDNAMETLKKFFNQEN